MVIEQRIKKDVPLASLTTLKVGGVARFFVEVENEQELLEAVGFAESKSLRLFILGGGSNVVISDKGFDGLVVKISIKGISLISETKQRKIFRVNSGENWDEFVEFCVRRNLAGIECLSGIPGTVGATPIQNVGAYGQEVSETIQSVRVFDLGSHKIFDLENHQCGFSYRASIFNTTQKNRFVILAVEFALEKNGKPRLAYKDLVDFFKGHNPSLCELRRAVIEIRKSKAMVISDEDINSRSCGSFFKNPIVSLQEYGEVAEKASKLGFREVPKYDAGFGKVKIPAAWLVEKAGFQKGYRMGNVGISEKHALAIVNFGNATAKEIIQLKNEIQLRVKEKFGIELMPEPVFVGFEQADQIGV
ncbi:MAG: UDP-N-acetylenolpyruvoylglucosamine reductase [Pyrinomonadaceae bacterium]|nr:MAG: UDP-N-acetylenolpyruvoylglucosamine reductase [Pyrinomonadaceae bacterium]